MPIVGPTLAAPVDLPNILQRGLDGKPDADALVSCRRRWSWRALDAVSSHLAAGYLDLGLVPGDRIATLLPNRTELVIHYLACQKGGFVAVPLNYRYMAPEIDHALEVSGARILLAHDERRDDLAASKLAGKLPLGRISYGDDGGESEPSFRVLTEGEETRDIAPPKPDDPAIIFFTSGSTGRPKGVCHSFATMGWIVASGIGGFGLGPDDVMLTGGSLSHVASHHLALEALAVGGRVVVARCTDGDEILPLLREERPTRMWMLPSALYALLRDHGASREDFASLKACFCGGDKVAAALETEFTACAGLAIDEDYGMTEIGNPTVMPPDRLKPGSCGPIAPGYQVELRDEQGREVATGKDGRFWVKFPGNMVGYWNDPAATAQVKVDGWVDSGDVMSADADGYLWFHGRLKQIIVHDGSNICPQEVEEALLEHGAVASAGVVGVRSERHGETVRAYVTLVPGAPRPSMQDLIRFARARIGYKAPEEIVVLDAMPLNATGKVDRVTLKKMAADAAGGDVS